MRKARVIWDNVNIMDEDYRNPYYEYLEEMGMSEEDMSLSEFVTSYIESNLDDERCNLDIETDGRILVIADLGLWNGRHSGYKILNKHNINSIFDLDFEYARFYSDGYNIKATIHHHDGVNHYIFREIRENKNIDDLLDDIYYGKDIKSKINKYTKSLCNRVSDVYGW